MRPRATVTYWRWGAEPKRVVLLVHTAVPGRRGQEATPGVAEVWGAEGRERVMLQRAEGVVSIPGGVRLTDGSEWLLARPGCGCQVPAALRGFTPKVAA